MTDRWTDTLIEPLATILRDGDWRMVQEARTGGWLALAFGSQTAWCLVEPDRMALQPLSPLGDRKLEVLVDHLSELLRRGELVRLLSWRVGRRAVIHRCGTDGETIDKLYRRPRSLGVRWPALGPSADGVWSTPHVSCLDEARGLLSMEVCGGVSLNERWLAGKGSAEDGERLAGLLDWIAATPIPDGLPSYGVEEEIAILKQRHDEYLSTLRRPDPVMRDLVIEVLAALRGLPPEPPVLVHRDLHDKQVVLDQERGRLLDLDLVAAGPAGLDAGNLLAHLRLRELCGANLPWSAVAERMVAGSDSARDRAAVAVWTAAALTRLALIYSRRRRSPDLLARLADSARNALGNDGEWATIFSAARIGQRASGSTG